MRIGDEHNFLLIEECTLEGDYAVLRVEAMASASGRKFTASNDRLMMEVSDETIQRFLDFAALKIAKFETGLTESGYVRFQRDSHGAITVRYRIGGWKALAAMEGELLVGGEFANRFCRDFEALIR
jgi:hypothetical protein